MPEIQLSGVPAAPGIAIGEVFLFRHDEPEFQQYCVVESFRGAELDRFEESLSETRRQLSTLRNRMSKLVGDAIARIFDAQAVILDDVEFISTIRNAISQEGLNAEAVVHRTANSFQEAFNNLDDEVFRGKAQDVHDVGCRIIRNLLGKGDSAIGPLDRPAILVTDDLLPSDVVHLLRKNVQAVAADLGGAASHTAILTRSLEVPSVVGLKDLTNRVKNGDRIIVNGNSGKVILNPLAETITSYVVKQNKYEEYLAELVDIEKHPAETTDGHRIALKANIELPGETKAALKHGCDGIGLFRSEYLFLTSNVIPGEEDQYKYYRQVIEAMAPNPVTIRTFDLGGDKVFTDLPLPVEPNPFMGWRAIRVFFDQPKLLHTQLRAILRAATAGPTRIMFPFVSGIMEIRQLKEIFEEIKSELEKEGFDFNPDVEIGVMIELPSAAIMADRIAKEVDFFSIGTNDLTQFVLAVDRGNERVRSLFRPLHPAVIRMIKMTVDAGHSAGIKVAICGELAANPTATMLLIGLGLDELSVSPLALGEIKKLVRSMSYEEAVEFTGKALEYDTAVELEHFCYDTMKHRFAELPIWFDNNSGNNY
ncbi:MAG: phosphoenolpyruvate--protein phosphotransferase [Candidatus Hatepunaea meridiana]|nr:phosphoenolpyruvate--protein phosphotransferase [Candidatus Hatepunaea meridiana]